MQGEQRNSTFKPTNDGSRRCSCNACFQIRNVVDEPTSQARSRALHLYNYHNPLDSHVPMLPYLQFSGPSSVSSFPPPSLHRSSYLTPVYVPENRFSLSGGQDLSKHEAIQGSHLVERRTLPSVSAETARKFWTTNNGSQDKPRRMRTVFSPHQLESMERHFKQQQYVGSAQRSYIASQLGLTETQVKVWFQNRRIRWRKQMLDNSVKSS